MTMELKVILPIAIGALGIGVAIWQFIKSKKLQEKTLEYAEQNQELQKSNRIIEAKNQELQNKIQSFDTQIRELQKKNQAIEVQNQALQKKGLTLETQHQELQKKSTELEAQNQELQHTIQVRQQEFEQKHLEYQQQILRYQQDRENNEELVQTITEDVQKLLVSASDEALSEYAPNITAVEEILPTQDNLPPLFLEQLEAGDLSAFKSLTITSQWLEETAPLVEPRLGTGVFTDILIKICTDSAPGMKAKRPVIIRYFIDHDLLKLDKPTVVAMLNFSLDMDNPHNQALELEAFALLKKKGPKNLKKFLKDITAKPPRNISSLNSAYIAKHIG